MIRLTCVFAVAGLSTRRAAISSFDRPAATRASTSRSRSVSAFSRGPGSGCRVRAANSAISRRVTAGAINASPRATTRTPWISSAGSVSLTRKPLAPARNAP